MKATNPRIKVFAALAIFAGHAAAQYENCAAYREYEGCDWTRDWSCPGDPTGRQGVAYDDGGQGYNCCCRSRESEAFGASVDCDAYHDETGCGWVREWGCPANDDGSPGYNCCCTCKGTVDYASKSGQRALDAVQEALYQCPNPANNWLEKGCMSYLEESADAVWDIQSSIETASTVCQNQAYQCASDIRMILGDLETITGHIDTALNCDSWNPLTCLGEATRVLGDVQNANANLNNLLQHCDLIDLGPTYNEDDRLYYKRRADIRTVEAVQELLNKLGVTRRGLPTKQLGSVAATARTAHLRSQAHYVATKQ